MEYECPECEDLMEDVEFSTGHTREDGIPGLFCHSCGHSLTEDELDDYLNDYDLERKEDEINNLNNRSS